MTVPWGLENEWLHVCPMVVQEHWPYSSAKYLGTDGASLRGWWLGDDGMDSSAQCLFP